MKTSSNRLVAATLLGLLGLLPAACGSDSKKAEAVVTDPSVENDPAVNAERFDTTKTEVPFEKAEDGANLALGDVFVATQVGLLSPPTVGGLVTQANEVTVSGTAVYVGYNYAGDNYAGAIDLIDISNLLSLQITSSLRLPGYDINGIERNGSYLYAVGASSASQGGFLSRYTLSGSLLTATSTQVALPSFAGTDVATTASKIYTTSGDTGGLNVLDLATMAAGTVTAIPDARAVSVTSAGIPWVLSGQTGKVNIMTAAGAASSSYALGGAATPQSKSTLVIGTKWSAASLGEGGFKVFCNADGSTIASMPQVTLSGVPAAKTVTNAITAQNGLIYTANGEAGIYVYVLRNSPSATACGAGTVSLLGYLNFGTGNSANGVFSGSGLLYVATGLGGLRLVTPVFTYLSAPSNNLL